MGKRVHHKVFVEWQRGTQSSPFLYERKAHSRVVSKMDAYDWEENYSSTIITTYVHNFMKTSVVTVMYVPLLIW